MRIDCSTGQPRFGLGNSLRILSNWYKILFPPRQHHQKIELHDSGKKHECNHQKHRHFLFIVYHVTKIQWCPLCNWSYLVGQEKVTAGFFFFFILGRNGIYFTWVAASYRGEARGKLVRYQLPSRIRPLLLLWWLKHWEGGTSCKISRDPHLHWKVFT